MMTKHENDSGNFRLMAVVDEMRFERQRNGPPSATAKVIVFDGLGGQTHVDIPVLSIVEKLDRKSRYLVEIQYRRMGDEEQFQPVAESENLVGGVSTDLFVVDCWAYGSVDEPTICKALAENRVVKITPTENGKFDVLEMCDKYFGATLTAEQLAEWGRELIALSSNANVDLPDAAAQDSASKLNNPAVSG